MNHTGRRSQRQSIELATLKQEQNSLLSWGFDDPVLQKLETYRLYRAGFAVADIAEAFDFSRGYLYELWDKFQKEGTNALIDKRCGTVPRKRTTEMEATILRTKAINPARSDSSLAKEFGLDRSTVYNLLKEHGLQDLHRVLDSSELDAELSLPKAETEKKTTTEIIPCQQALLLSLLNPLVSSRYMDAMVFLSIPELDRYNNEQLQLCLVLLAAKFVNRISHINDLPQEDWGLLLDSHRRPDSDTLDQYLNRLIELDETMAEVSVVERQGQIRPGGLIDLAQQASLCGWVSAGLLAGDVWYFDGHVLEYTGTAKLNKTKHGTKQCSVKAVKRYTLQNGLCSLSEYFPSHMTFAEALRILVTKANNCLPEAHKIRYLAFDREGWDTDLFHWLQKHKIVSMTWVKKTASNVQSLINVPDEEFVTIERPFGKGEPQKIGSEADTEISFDSLGIQRTVVLETDENHRCGIFTMNLNLNEDNELKGSPKDDFQLVSGNSQLLFDQQEVTTESISSLPQEPKWPVMTATDKLDTMRFKQRVENQFFVTMHEMGCDMLPTHTTYKTNKVQDYNFEEKQNQLNNATKRLQKYASQHQQQQQLYESGQLDKHQFNLLNKRLGRLQQQTEQEIETIIQEQEYVQKDDNEQMVLLKPTEVLDVRKLTLFNLFKLLGEGCFENTGWYVRDRRS